MKLFEYLGDYRKRADGFLEEFLRLKVENAKEFGSPSLSREVTVAGVEMFGEFSLEGKKIRGALVELGYLMGGKNDGDILEVSVAMEVLHTMVLMHDDMMDRDGLRRGLKTVHLRYAEMGIRELDGEHYGNSMEMLVGDLGYTWAWELLALSNFGRKEKEMAVRVFVRMIENTIYGQMLDASFEDVERLTDEEIMKVYLSKSAWYTISGPLQLGGVLGGVSEEVLAAMQVYGEAVGIAFQMRDDELDLFGNEMELGKPVGSDVREGKHTLLKMKVMELVTEEDAEYLRRMYGNSAISEDDLKRVREIHVESGALAYSQMRAGELVAQGKKVVEAITADEYLRTILLELAEYVVTRDK